MHPEPLGDVLALKTLGAEQDHPALVRERGRRLVPSNLGFEKALLIAQRHLRPPPYLPSHHLPTARINETNTVPNG